MKYNMVIMISNEEKILSISLDAINEYAIKELSNLELDFIAYVVSPFHALGVDAFVHTLSINKKNLNGLIFIQSHPKDGIVVSEVNFRCMKFANVKLVYIQKPILTNRKNVLQLSQTAIRVLKGFYNTVNNQAIQKKDLYFIYVMEVPILLFELLNNKGIIDKYSPRFVSIDEGTGSYLDENTWKLVRKYDNKNRDITKSQKDKALKSLIVNTFLINLKALIKNYIIVENRHILIQSASGFIPNKESIDGYKEVLCLSKNEIPECIRPLLTKKWAVIATQPFVDYGQITAGSYISIIVDVIKLLQEKGFNVALKLHPRENYEMYKINAINKDIMIVPKNITLEEILQFRPNITIGFTSTVLITSHLFYEIPSISLVDLILKFTNDPLLSVISKQFKEKFGNLVSFAYSKEELAKKLDDLNLGPSYEESVIRLYT